MHQRGRTASGRVRPRAALVLALLCVVALGPVPRAPAAVGKWLVSRAMLPLDGLVGDVSLTGVVHVVTQVTFHEDPNKLPTLTVNANLPAGDVSVEGAPGVNYLAHGAGKATMELDDLVNPSPAYVPGFVLMTLGAVEPPPPAPPIVPVAFALQLNLSFTAAGMLIPDVSSATAVKCGGVDC